VARQFRRGAIPIGRHGRKMMFPVTILHAIAAVFWRWIDAVAETVDALRQRLRLRQRIRLVEDEGGTFTFRVVNDAAASIGQAAKWTGFSSRRKPAEPAGFAPLRSRIVDGAIAEPLPAPWATMLHGSHVEFVLRPKRFLFRPLELPRPALDFLDGIIRVQIDRLTPWNAEDAVFGWTRPVDIAPDRIALSIIAAPRSMVSAFVHALASRGAASVTISTPDASADAAPIAVFTQRAESALQIGRTRRILAAAILIAALAALGSIALSAMTSDGTDAELRDLSGKIAARRAAMRLGDGALINSAERALAQRKQATPSSVLVLEELSKILPDHTYITELHVEGDKLQVVGITRDAPSLIELIEQSAQFTRATFFAPTTQTPGDPGERFHIEARIKPQFASGT
jgi:general secretion pathway protein L